MKMVPKAVYISLTDCERKFDWPYGETFSKVKADKIAIKNRNSSDPVRKDFYKIREKILPVYPGRGKGWLGKRAIEELNNELETEPEGNAHFAGGHGIAKKSTLCRQANEWIKENRFTTETGIPLMLWRYYDDKRFHLEKDETVSTIEEYLNGPSAANSNLGSTIVDTSTVEIPATKTKAKGKAQATIITSPRQKRISSASKKRSYAESFEDDEGDNEYENCEITDDEEEEPIPLPRRQLRAAGTQVSKSSAPQLARASAVRPAISAAVAAANKEKKIAAIHHRAFTMSKVCTKIIAAIRNQALSASKPQQLLLDLLRIAKVDDAHSICSFRRRLKNRAKRRSWSHCTKLRCS